MEVFSRELTDDLKSVDICAAIIVIKAHAFKNATGRITEYFIEWMKLNPELKQYLRDSLGKDLKQNAGYVAMKLNRPGDIPEVSLRKIREDVKFISDKYNLKLKITDDNTYNKALDSFYRDGKEFDHTKEVFWFY